LLYRGQQSQAPAEARFGRLVDRADRGPVEVHIGRLDIEDARFEQRLLGRNGDLLIDEMSNTRGARAGHERLAQRFDGLGLVRLEQTKWHALGTSFAGGE